MYLRKIYGQSKTEKCPFCERLALSVNSDGIPVCQAHKKNSVEFRCACGEWLDLRKSKWGVFFSCINCGAVSMHKALEMNSSSGSADYKLNSNLSSKLNNKKDELNNKSEGLSEKGESVKASENEFIIDLPDTSKSEKQTYPEKKGKKEITVRSDDPDYC